MLGATVFSQPIAWAAQAVDATITGPLDNGNVRIHEERPAAVHEQGTANVQVTNKSLPVAPPPAIRDGGGTHITCAGAETCPGLEVIDRSPRPPCPSV